MTERSGFMPTMKSATRSGTTVTWYTNDFNLDKAFKAPSVPNLSKLTNAEVVTLLQYHALNSYYPKGALKTTKGPISTLATNCAGKFDLSVTTTDDEVTLHTGVSPSRVADTVLDLTPLAIFTVDSVLLPTELFGKMAPSPAPVGEPVASPSPSPDVASPSPSPVSEAPSPLAVCQWRLPEVEILLPTRPVARWRRLPLIILLEETSPSNSVVHVNGAAFFAVVVSVVCSVLLS
ncbi:hypothetical protein Q3G72_026573 [Acer saccharum]|nr:hypothetical protein Q3G72_026573 [Acer saccharum]